MVSLPMAVLIQKLYITEHCSLRMGTDWYIVLLTSVSDQQTNRQRRPNLPAVFLGVGVEFYNVTDTFKPEWVLHRLLVHLMVNNKVPRDEMTDDIS